MIRVKKKSFLLVEVVVGLTLFSLCALPLLQQPFLLTVKSYDRLFEAELSRLADVAYTDLLANIHSGEITWASLPKSPKFDKPCNVSLGDSKRSYLQTTDIMVVSSKKTAEQQEARKLKITIGYIPEGKTKKAQTFTYYLTTVGPLPTG